MRAIIIFFFFIFNYPLISAERNQFIEVKKSINEILEDGYKAEKIFTFETTNAVSSVIHFFKGKKYIICYLKYSGSLCQKPK